MPAGPDFIAAVTARIAEVEMARRVPGWTGPAAPAPAGLPPVTVLADATFPRAVLERRLRFLRAVGWYPAPPPEATVEDQVAAALDGDRPTAADPAIDALWHALRPEGPDPTGRGREAAAVTAFFDHQADGVDPGWRRRRPPDALGDTTWARWEAATRARFFGRRSPGWGARLVWWLAERKRHRWG